MQQKPSTYHHDRMVSMLKAKAGKIEYLTIFHPFVSLTHDLILALMLSQLLYWSDRTTRADGFVFKSATDWYNEVGATKYAVLKFKKLPYVITKIVFVNGSLTTHYRIDMEKLEQALLANNPVHEQNSDEQEPEMGRSNGRNEPVDKPNPDNGKTEMGHSTDRNKTNHQLISDDPPSENDQTLTNITTDTTTDNTTIKRGPPENFIMSELADQEIGIDEQETDNSPEENEILKPQNNSAAFKKFSEVLADITGYDIRLKATSRRVLVAARQLVQAGYTLDDLQNFLPYWRENDWRWKKDHQLPTPEDVLIHCSKARAYQQSRSGAWLRQPSEFYGECYARHKAENLRLGLLFKQSQASGQANPSQFRGGTTDEIADPFTF